MVEVTTLDALLDRHPLDSVDLIKIDTEGQEVAVLSGMREKAILCHLCRQIGPKSVQRAAFRLWKPLKH